jgi:T1SS-143 domain-containing protein
MSTNFTNKDIGPKNLPKEPQDHVITNNTNASEKATMNTEGWMAYLQHRLFGNDDGKSGAPAYDALEPKVAAIPEIPTIHWTDKYVTLEVAKIEHHNEHVIQLAKLQLLLEDDGQSFVDLPAPYPLGHVAPGFDTIGLKFAFMHTEENFMFRVENPSTFISTPIPQTPLEPTGRLENIAVEEDDVNTLLSLGNNEDNSVSKNVFSGDFSPLVSKADATFALVDNGQPNLGLPALTSQGENIQYSIIGDTLYGMAGGREIFTLEVKSDGTYTFTLNDQVDHPAAGNDENFLHLDVGSLIHAYSGGDEIVLSPNNVVITIQDDVPLLDGNIRDVHGLVLEDGMSKSTGDLSEGNKESGETNSDDETGAPPHDSLLVLFKIGTDEFSPNDTQSPRIQFLDNTSSLPNLLSKGDAVHYDVNSSHDVITGYVDSNNSGGLDGNDRVVFTLSIDKITGNWQFDLQDQLDHVAGNGENFALRTTDGENTQTPNIDFSQMLTAFDHDGDHVEITTSGKFFIEVQDDVPVANCIQEGPSEIATERVNPENDGCESCQNGGDDCMSPLTGLVLEDGMSILLGDGDSSEGNKESGESNDSDETSGQLLTALFTPGADEDLTISLSTDTHNLDKLYSNGVELQYEVNGNTLTATAGNNIVFTLTVNSDGSWNFDLRDQLDHWNNGLNNENFELLANKFPGDLPGSYIYNIVNGIDFSSIIVATDSDGDSVTAKSGGFIINVQDDVPIIHENDLVKLDDDALANGNPGGINDANPDTANTSGVLNFSIGSDEHPTNGATLQFLTNGAPNGFTYEESYDGSSIDTLYIKQGGILKITITVDQEGHYQVVQNAPIDHAPGMQENDQSFNVSYRVTDGDGDHADGLLQIRVNDDTPEVKCIKIGDWDDNPGHHGGDEVTGLVVPNPNDCVDPIRAIVLEDGMSKSTGDLSEGNKESGESLSSDETNSTLMGQSLASFYTSGADTPLTIKISSDTSGLADLYSQGEKLVYHVNAAGDELTATAHGDLIFTLHVNTDGTWSFDLHDQLDHLNDGNNDENFDLQTTGEGNSVPYIDFSSVIQAFDHDMDPAGNLPNGAFVISVQDDIPSISFNDFFPFVVPIQEDGMSFSSSNPGPDYSEGNKDPGDDNTVDELSGNLNVYVNTGIVTTTGADEPLSGYTYNLLTNTDNLPKLLSNGEVVTYNVVGNVLTASANGHEIFTFTVDNNGLWSFDLKDQLDHVAGDGQNIDLRTDGGGIVGGLDFSSIIQISVTDFDGDTVSSLLPQGLFIIQIEDDVPVVGENSEVHLDDDALQYGIPNGVGDIDPDSQNTSGTLNFSVGADDPGSIQWLNTGAPNGFTYDVSNEGGLSFIEVKQDGNTVFTINLDSNGHYDVTQVAPINHPDGMAENIQDFNIGYRVTDADGDYTDGTLKIVVNDDSPHAQSQAQNLVVNVENNANVMLIFDVSNSMTTASGIAGLNRFDASKQAAVSLLNQYQSVFNYTKVQIVTFGTFGHIQTPGNTWVDVASAIAIINALTLPGGNNGATNYQDALNVAMNAYDNAGKIATGSVTNVSYFLSDGDPTVPLNGNLNSGGSTENEDRLSTFDTDTWTNYVDVKDIHSYAFGMGTGISNPSLELNKIAYDGSGAGTDTNASIITNFSQLIVALNSTVTPGSVSGNLFTLADIGADQPGHIQAISIENDGKTYSFDGQNISVSGNGASNYTYDPNTHILVIQTNNLGTFTVNMITGAYTYDYSGALGFGDHQFVNFTISDHDNDLSSASIDFTLTKQPNDVVNDIVTINHEPNVVIASAALLMNDSVNADPSTISLVAGSVSTNATVFYDNINHEFQFSFNNNINDQVGHFEYKVLVNGLYETAFVTVVQDGTGLTLTGDNTNNFINGLSGDDTINGLAGIDTIHGNAGNDVIDGGNDADFIFGDAGNDLLIGGASNNAVDTLNGGDGNDILRGGGGNDIIDGGNGIDMIDYSDALAVGTSANHFLLGLSNVQTIGGILIGSVGVDTYTGIEGVIGSSSNDFIDGNAEDNIIRGGAGNDRIDGMGGKDLIDFSDATGGMTFILPNSGNGATNTGGSSNAGGLGTDTYFNIEGVIGTNFNDTLTGNNSDNVFNHQGYAGIMGMGGDDKISPNGGADTLSGGLGHDTFIFTLADIKDGTGATANHVVTIQDFTATNVAGDPNADTLDLSALLNNASNDANSLSDYLHITSDGTNTSIEVKKDGAADANGVDLTIQLNGVDLTHGGTHSEHTVIQQMLNNQNLHGH